MSKPVFSDLFTFSGRRNRKSYFLYWVLWMVVVLIMSVLIGVSREDAMSVVVVLAALVLLAMAISGWIVTAQRCRDFGWSGWATLLTAIPAFGFFFSLFLVFMPGDAGQNRYGPDPLALPGAATAGAIAGGVTGT